MTSESRDRHSSLLRHSHGVTIPSNSHQVDAGLVHTRASVTQSLGPGGNDGGSTGGEGGLPTGSGAGVEKTVGKHCWFVQVYGLSLV